MKDVHVYILWQRNAKTGGDLRAYPDGVARNATDLNKVVFWSLNFSDVCGINS